MKTTDKVNLTLGWPCYCCVYNQRQAHDEPCARCEGSDGHNEESFFSPILEPK